MRYEWGSIGVLSWPEHRAEAWTTLPLTRRSLALAAEPASVPLARAWVTDVFTEIGRGELVPAAQLGVSELVTNAILHARPPLTVSVRGTVEHPRVEVVDHAPGPIRPRDLALIDADETSTFGRGLAMVALNATQWGSETLPDQMGKRVWFEPSAEMNDQLDLEAAFADLEQETGEEAAVPPADSLRVVLLGLPVPLLVQLRRYHFELRRELRLLALADPERYPLAVRITELFMRADAQMRASSGFSGLDDAVERGLDKVDVELAVPADGPEVVSQLAGLLERTYEVFADEYLLAMAPPPELRALQGWYFGQVIAQGAGAEPEPWSADRVDASTSVC